MQIKIGDKAPLFELPDTDKKMVKLADCQGKNVVVLFFPAAFTGTCTKEMCQTRDELAMFNSLNAVVFGISVDLPFSLNKFKEDQKLNFTLLSDFNKQACTAYGCMFPEWIAGLKGVAKRASFVIDKAGIVRFAEVLETAGEYPNFEGIHGALQKMSD